MYVVILRAVCMLEDCVFDLLLEEEYNFSAITRTKQSDSNSRNGSDYIMGSNKMNQFVVIDSISDSDSAGHISDYLSSQNEPSRTRITRSSPSNICSPDSHKLFTDTIDVSSSATVQQIVKKELSHHYAIKNITEHQYYRILQRATEKIMKGKPTNMDRVKKLVFDFVEQYKLSCQ